MVKMSRQVVLVALVLLVAALIGARLAERDVAGRLADQGRADLILASDRLQGQLDRYRDLPAVLSAHPEIVVALSDPGTRDRANRVLEDMAARTGALDIYIMDATGLTVASSNWGLPRSFLGKTFSWRPYFKQAVAEGTGFYHAVGTTSDRRGFFFAAPIGADGVIAVKVDLEEMEADWRGHMATVFFADENDVIFLSNRDGLVLKSLGAPRARDTLEDPLQYARREILPLPERTSMERFGERLWLGPTAPDVPERAIWLTHPVSDIGMEAHILVGTDPALRQAWLGAALGAALSGVLLLVARIMQDRRRALAEQLQLEERANARLEADVARRTSELEAANAELRAENAERLAAETALRQVQEELVQAVKLKALGEMSAGISHELNQPLAAIQSLADNGSVMMERGLGQSVQGNLERISQIAARMGRIIKALRGFARKEGEPATDVSLVEVVDDALSLAAGRLSATETEVVWARPAHDVMVRGGRVRLQQVVLNLISNAIDAMEGQSEPRKIEISLDWAGDGVRLTVQDSGPGLKDPEQIFDPFYTTKPVGKGLGLGLSISYGIVQSFGGKIRGANVDGGGTAFTVELAGAREEISA